jgi:outer membrane immunogenic protein
MNWSIAWELGGVMKRLQLAALVVAAVSAGGSAFAADMPVKAIYKAPIVLPWTWTGFYVGGNVGYSWGRASTDFSESSSTTSVVTATTTGVPPLPLPGNGLTTVTAASAAGSAASNMNGWLAGLQAGYNWQTNFVVFGLEADIQGTGQRDDPLFCAIPGCPAGSLFGTSTTKLPWFATFRGRIGITSDPWPTWGPVLLYVTGGLAVARIDASYTGGLVGGPVGAVSTSTTRAGWVLGVGGEGRIARSNWTVKVEYLYMDYGSVSGVVGAAGAPVITPFGINNSDQIHFITSTTTINGAASTRVTDQVLRVGLNYKFPPQ